MVLIIDNYDSFTYNLYQQIAALGHAVTVVRHDQISTEGVAGLRPTHIVISPGPKRPANSGISLDVIRRFSQTTPILGVCLGHQCIGEAFGARVVPAPTIVHGKVAAIRHTGSGLFKGVPDPFAAARYHSLVVDALPEHFRLTAWSQDGTIMAIQHKEYPLYGVQFHPESFMTTRGDAIMRNFLTCQRS